MCSGSRRSVHKSSTKTKLPPRHTSLVLEFPGSRCKYQPVCIVNRIHRRPTPRLEPIPDTANRHGPTRGYTQTDRPPNICKFISFSSLGFAGRPFFRQMLDPVVASPPPPQHTPPRLAARQPPPPCQSVFEKPLQDEHQGAYEIWLLHGVVRLGSVRGPIQDRSCLRSL